MDNNLYFTTLDFHQKQKVRELALEIFANGGDVNDYYYIRFAGDISSNSDEVLELVKITSPSSTAFKLEVYMNVLNLLPSKVLVPSNEKLNSTIINNETLYPSEVRKLKKKQKHSIAMNAVRTVLNPSATKEQKSLVISNLRTELSNV